MPSINNGDIKIYFEVHGEGIPIVLGHSFLCSGAMWESQVAPLAEHYQVINIDARGHGESGPITADFTLYDMVDDVIAVLDHLGLKSAVWAGLSIGGMVALRAAVEKPDRVRGLMLLDTDSGPEKASIRFKYTCMGLIARTLGFKLLIPQIVPLMFCDATLQGKTDLVSFWTKRFETLHVPSILYMLKALKTRDDLNARLPEISVPALVLVGDQDRSLPPSRSRVIADGLSDARFIEIADAGHLSAVEQPETVTALMLEFMERFEAERASKV